MKDLKIFAWPLAITAMLFVVSCAASKEGRSMKHTINGTWTLKSVNAEGINTKYKASVFNEADASCFTGSTWTFISNNSMGTYTISPATGCASATRNFRWSIYEPKGEEKRFQFKRLDEKKNPMDDNDGFRLRVTSLTETNMQLKSAVVFEGRPATLVYNFTKN